MTTKIAEIFYICYQRKLITILQKSEGKVLILWQLLFENSRPAKFDARCQIFDVDASSNGGQSFPPSLTSETIGWLALSKEA